MANIERRTRLRAGDTDRDAVLEVLHSAFAAGRLTPSDLADRQEAALSARYIDELPELVEDVPEGASLVGGWGSSMPAQHPWSVTPASGWSRRRRRSWAATPSVARRRAMAATAPW